MPTARYDLSVICLNDHKADTGGMSRDIVVRFGRRVREIRNAKGIIQTVLAERVGTDQSTLSRIENGKQETCLKFIELLAMGLKTPLGELFKDL
jgi:ribosome-binding protein aMBF1 (putative translation factor)